MPVYELVYAGPWVVPAPPPPPVVLVRQVPDFDPATGFSEAGGVVSVAVAVREDHFGEGKLAPSRVVVRVFQPETITGLSLASILTLAPLAESAADVSGPGVYSPGVVGLEPGREYGFAILAEYPE